MSTSVFLVALCLMVTMVVAQTSPSKKQCLSKGTSTWTACTDNKMNQTFTSTFTGCSTDPLVQVLNCTYSKTKASKKRDCAKTIMDDLTTCATGAIFNRTYSEAGTQCKVRKQTAKKSTEMDCNKFYKVKGEKVKGEKKGGKKASKKAKRINRKSKRIARDQCKYRRGTWKECDAVTNVRRMVRTLKKQRPGCPLTLTIEKACRPSRKQQRGCKYKRGQWSECDGTTNIKTMVKTLKRGDPASCPPTQTKEKICKRKHAGLKDNCKYRKAGRWSTCDMKTGLIYREMVLKKGDANVCLPSKTVTKSCSKKRGNRGKSGCKYDKSVWSPCDAATNKVTRTLTLVSGDPTLCNATKTQTKRCKDKHLRPHLCKYRRTSWGECDPGTNMREMVKTLKRGDPSKCEPTQTIERKCRSSRNTKVCKYKKEPWSACDPTTNLIMRRQVLQSGPATCRSVKEYTRKCKKECRFVSGEWSECDIESEQMTRVDNLRPGSLETCPSTRVLNKPCGRKEKRCVYGEADWLECDSSDQPVRTRTQPLMSGGPSCLPERVTTKSCKKKNGQERCFYGPWQAYDECQNGVRKKIRTVLQGGLECERKSVKMKAC